MVQNSSKNCEGAPYKTPSAIVLDVMSEGMLCSSYDTPGSGYDDENDLGEI